MVIAIVIAILITFSENILAKSYYRLYNEKLFFLMQLASIY